jgi:hypothetical protein
MWKHSCDIFLLLHCVFLRHAVRIIVTENQGQGSKYSDKKNFSSFVMWYDFYPTPQGSGVENTEHVG